MLVGQALFAVALVLTWLGADHQGLVLAALILLGLGWSASTVSGSTMVTESVATHDRPGLQGTSDLTMNLCGAAGGALAGPVLALVGFSGLGLMALVLVAITVLPNRRQLLTGATVAALATPAFTTGAAAAPSKTAFNTAGIDAALANLVRDGAVGVTTSVVGPGGTYLSAAGKRDL